MRSFRWGNIVFPLVSNRVLQELYESRESYESLVNLELKKMRVCMKERDNKAYEIKNRNKCLK